MKTNRHENAVAAREKGEVDSITFLLLSGRGGGGPQEGDTTLSAKGKEKRSKQLANHIPPHSAERIKGTLSSHCRRPRNQIIPSFNHPVLNGKERGERASPFSFPRSGERRDPFSVNLYFGEGERFSSSRRYKESTKQSEPFLFNRKKRAFSEKACVVRFWKSKPYPSDQKGACNQAV